MGGIWDKNMYNVKKQLFKLFFVEQNFKNNDAKMGNQARGNNPSITDHSYDLISQSHYFFY